MREENTKFVQGLDLCQSFYFEVVAPLISSHFPDLSYTAGLIGSGSDILGYDSEMSSDHDWGPRLQIFLTPADLSTHQSALTKLIAGDQLPSLFGGYSVLREHMVVTSIQDFFKKYIGVDSPDVRNWQLIDWLTIPEQKLLGLTSGRVFRDDLNLNALRAEFTYFPHEVWLYLLSCGWNRIEQEEHLMGRAGIAGDDVGSALLASRLVRDVMRLCFLMEKRYAPYPKWFGTAFKKLSVGLELYPLCTAVLAATSWEERELHLSKLYCILAKMHNELGLTEPLRESTVEFHERPFKVISMGLFSAAIKNVIADPTLRAIADKPLIGSIDQWSDGTDMLTNSCWRKTIVELYKE